MEDKSPHTHIQRSPFAHYISTPKKDVISLFFKNEADAFSAVESFLNSKHLNAQDINYEHSRDGVTRIDINGDMAETLIAFGYTPCVPRFRANSSGKLSFVSDDPDPALRNAECRYIASQLREHGTATQDSSIKKHNVFNQTCYELEVEESARPIIKSLGYEVAPHLLRLKGKEYCQTTRSPLSAQNMRVLLEGEAEARTVGIRPTNHPGQGCFEVFIDVGELDNIRRAGFKVNEEPRNRNLGA